MKPHAAVARPSTNGTDGRDEQTGRFLAGNRYGRGNPFARRCAALRKAFYDEATEADVQALCRTLLDKGKAGDVGAAKLALLWLLGTPPEAVDPDRLDLQEAALELAAMMQGHSL
jgi:hypothetical protein